MARQVLTYPDIPPVLTQAAGDARYSLVAHNHDAAYATVAHLHTGVYQPAGSYSLTSHNHDAAYSATTHLHDSNYLKLSGGNLTGPLTFGGDVTLSRTGAGALQLGGTSFSLLAGAGQHANINIDAPADFYKVVALKEAGSLRWQLGSPGDAATGDFYLWRYPAGVAPLRVSRANGTLTLNPDAGYPATVNGPGNSTWQSDYRTHQLGVGGALYAHIGYPQVGLAANIYYPVGGGTKYVSNGLGATFLIGQDGTLYFDTAVNGTAGAAATMSQRLKVDGGTFVYNHSGGPSFHVGAGAANSNARVASAAANSRLEVYGTGFVPFTDGFMFLGEGTYRWTTVFATSGAISTSVYSAKEDFAPLDPVACASAVLETDWVQFAYRPPGFPEQPDLGLEPKEQQTRDTEAKAGYLKLVAETAYTREQKGYVLQSPVHKTADLFGLSDRESTSVASDLAVVACALQHCLLEIAELKARLA